MEDRPRGGEEGPEEEGAKMTTHPQLSSFSLSFSSYSLKLLMQTCLFARQGGRRGRPRTHAHTTFKHTLSTRLFMREPP